MKYFPFCASALLLLAGCGGGGTPTSPAVNPPGPPKNNSSTCLASGTGNDIQHALDTKGAAELCQGAVFTIIAPIHFGPGYSSMGTRVFTTGLPTDSAKKALLRVPDNVSGWCDTGGCAVLEGSGDHLSVEAVRIDGNRRSNGFIYHAPLIAILGNHIIIDHNELNDSMGLSAISTGWPPCTDDRITNNVITTVGVHGDPNTTPEPAWASGIDLLCSDSYVAYNEIRDASDGPIEYFGGKNTIIEHNHIIAETQSSFSGIIVDGALFNIDSNGHPLPTPLDQSGTIVQNNVIETRNGHHIHAALGMGTHLWCSDVQNNPDCGYGANATANNNQLIGNFGWGIFVGGMDNATVTGNSLTMTEWNTYCSVSNQQELVLEEGHGTLATAQDGFVTRPAPLHWPCLIAPAE